MNQEAHKDQRKNATRSWMKTKTTTLVIGELHVKTIRAAVVGALMAEAQRMILTRKTDLKKMRSCSRWKKCMGIEFWK